MNPELQRKLDDLQRQIDDIRRGADIEMSEGIRRRTIVDIITGGTVDTASTSNILKSVNEAGASTYSVAKAFNKRMRIEHEGSAYHIGLYDVS